GYVFGCFLKSIFQISTHIGYHLRRGILNLSKSFFNRIPVSSQCAFNNVANTSKTFSNSKGERFNYLPCGFYHIRNNGKINLEDSGQYLNSCSNYLALVI